MTCPTRDHTMCPITSDLRTAFWCPQCGTLWHDAPSVPDRVHVPGEVARLRALVESPAARVAGQSELLARRAEVVPRVPDLPGQTTLFGE